MHILDLLIDEVVGTKHGGNLGNLATVPDELGAGGHVDAVHVRKTNGRRGRRERYLVRTGSPSHVDNFFRRGPAHDGVVDDEHVFALELARHGVELLPHRAFALGLPGHDERAANVAVFVEAFAVFDAELSRHLHGGRTRRIGNRHDNVDVARGCVFRDRIRKSIAQTKPRLVHGDAIHDGVGTGEIDVFKGARHENGIRGALLRKHLTLGRDEDGLARFHVANDVVARAFEHKRLTRYDPFGLAVLGRSRTQNQRPNTERVAEGQHAVPCDYGDCSVGAFDPRVDTRHGVEQVAGIEGIARNARLDFGGQHIQQKLGITRRIDVSAVNREQIARELARVRQVSIVNEDDAIGRVDIEGLRLLLIFRSTRRGVAHVTDAHRAEQRTHVTRAIGLTNLALCLKQMKLTSIGGGHAGGILTAVLEQQQCVVDVLINRFLRDDSDDAAHAICSLLRREDRDRQRGSIRLPKSRTLARSIDLGPMSDSYARAGVDTAAGDLAVELMKASVRATHGPEVVGGVGGFAGLFDVGFLTEYRHPLLATSTDGVGTKVALAQAIDKHDTIGFDLVGMVVDDIIVTGARPLFMTDYIACGKVVPERIAAIVKGIADACAETGTALVGGETAEHPGLLAPDEYDIAGAATGVVERDALLGADRVQHGDVVVACASSGLHSNGYSLVRHILAQQKLAFTDHSDALGGVVGEVLLEPTRLYTGALLEILVSPELGPSVHALSHVTGGGIAANLARVLPQGAWVDVDRSTWSPMHVFRVLADMNGEPLEATEGTWNLGLGMLAVVSPDSASAITTRLSELGIASWVVGMVSTAKRDLTGFTQGAKGVDGGAVRLVGSFAD